MKEQLKKFKRLLNIFIWSFVGFYLALAILLQIPFVQSQSGLYIGEMLSKKIGTKVTIDKINIGFFNRIIVDGVHIEDQKKQEMICASRLSAKIEITQLIRGNISIVSAQIFGLNAHFYKSSSDAIPNFQFALDSLSSKNNKKSSAFFKIHSLILRNGKVCYNQLDVPKSNVFSLKHIALSNLSSHIIINQLSKDSININLKNLSFKEKSGLQINKFTTKLMGNKNHLELNSFLLELPSTKIYFPNSHFIYQNKNESIDINSIKFYGHLVKSKIFLPDFAFVNPKLKKFSEPLDADITLNGTSKSLSLSDINLSSKDFFEITGELFVKDFSKITEWSAKVNKLKLYRNGLLKYFDLDKNNSPFVRVGDIFFCGKAYKSLQKVSLDGDIHTAIGQVKVEMESIPNGYIGHLHTDNLNLATLLNDKRFGNIRAIVELSYQKSFPDLQDITIKGSIPVFDFEGRSYNNITLNGIGRLNSNYQIQHIQGVASVDDTKGKIEIQGEVKKDEGIYKANVDVNAQKVDLSFLNFGHPWNDRSISLQAETKLTGNKISNLSGDISLHNLRIDEENMPFMLSNLQLRLGSDKSKEYYISLNSDFGNALIVGDTNISNLIQACKNIVLDKLPGIKFHFPIEEKPLCCTNVRLYADINNGEWIRYFFNTPISLHQPILLSGLINSEDKQLSLSIQAPKFKYKDNVFQGTNIKVSTQNDTLLIDGSMRKFGLKNDDWYFRVVGKAANNHLVNNISFKNLATKALQGSVSSEAIFSKDADNKPTISLQINPSSVCINDSLWTINPSSILYAKNFLEVNRFNIHHKNQYFTISGRTSAQSTDSLIAQFNNVNVGYILNLLNFHAVEFDGLLTGKAQITHLFNKVKANADVTITPFLFQSGQMGILKANVDWNEKLKQIDINARINNNGNVSNIIGYMSPTQNYLDLGINAKHLSLGFIQGFLSSVTDKVNATGTGKVRLFGDLKNLNLAGEAVANGNIRISSLNTEYTMKNDTIRLIPNKIIFKNDTILDRNSNLGVLSGEVNHQSLKNITFLFDIKADNLLAYDTHSFGTETFYGTAVVTGDCSIKGKPGEVIINVNATPQKGSQIVYNASTQNSVAKQNFIQWVSQSNQDSINSLLSSNQHQTTTKYILPQLPSDLYLNLIINSTPDMSLRLLMDTKTGDYIQLHGSGVLRAAYYNKGAFEMFGNYSVDHGIYQLTIQNIIKKDFEFQKGGVIAFGGDPYNASLDLKALYVVNGASLADLNIGKSFSSNNVRVDCMMNITGTPMAPKVDFNLEFPTINTNARQMVYSLMNSQEEMNQQVLYLLAIGRFYSQGANNNSSSDGTSQQKQASLAMQSILSGTLSQQINNVLSSVVNSSNWNFGANISTGNEGFYNAEYEGLLSGKLLNNRLLIDGQFGYRDNANATTSFIGDFDIKYLLLPNGNLAVRVYNQTNDRYFTRNSLTTQGIGLIIQKDFTILRDLFGIRRSKKQTLKDK